MKDLAMVVDLPPWALKAMDKIHRGLQHCLLAWTKVTRPLELGGLAALTTLQFSR